LQGVKLDKLHYAKNRTQAGRFPCTLSFKVTAELKIALEKAAALDERSLSSLVQHILSRAMRERKLLK
jgi:hypothetical protein